MNPSTLDVILWKPHSKVVTKMDKFRQLVNEKYSLTLKNYPELYQWSVDKYSDFWETFLKFDGIVYSKSYDNVVDTKKKINEIPEWFHGSRLNYAENVLRYNVDRIAIYEFSETIPKVKSLTYAELRHRVALYANSMKKLGVKVGDRIAAYMPNCSATVEAMLAAASLGAVWSSTSPDFGVTAVLDRFTQIKPKLLFSVNAVVYNGKVHNHFDKTMQVLKGLPEVEKLIVIPFHEESASSFKISDDPRTILLDDFLKLSKEQTPNLEFEQVPFNHPLFIMFSSGTTGKPKCLVHSAGGTLIQLVKEHSLHGNCTGNDIVIYYTTVGWMMWNWLITALSTGASIVLFDGSPFLPKPNILWDLVDEIGITIFGTSAKWLALIEDKGFKPMTTHKLTSMHTVLSTGSPLKPHSYDYVYRDIKKDVMLGSITGGTDIISCFMGQNCVLPVVRGEIQSRNLGMAVESWDETGQPVYGRSGELVCVKPFPSMPIYFLNDSDGKKYHNAYFNKFPGVWHHGDYCLINPNTGGIVMQGRSDGTLNPGGVRFGSADIYNIVEKYNEVEDSLCVSQNLKEGDERVVLFLKMANGHNFNEDLIQRIKNDIRFQLSARHVPAIILQAPDIPYTHNGKKVEIAVKKIISNQDVTERGALANPDSLNFFYNIAQLKI